MNALKWIANAVLRDWPWKLTSIAIAITLWYVAINVTNPTTSIPVPLRLELRGLEQLAEERRLVVNEAALQATSVLVNVRCKQSDVGDIKDKLEAYLDFSTVQWLTLPQTGQPVSAQLNVGKKNSSDDFEIMDISPRNVSVTIDRQVTYARGVVANPGLTDTPEGYVYLTPIQVSPSVINVTGAETQVAKVASVAVSVDLTDKTEPFQTVGRIHAYDTEGNELFVKLGDTMATVSVTVNKLGFIPLARPQAIGEPAEGFIVTGISYNLKELQVMGAAEDISQLTQIKLDPVDISGAAGTVKKTYDLRDEVTGTRLNIVNGTAYECEVTVAVERLAEKTFTVPISEILTTGYTEDARIDAEPVVIRVSGARANIDKLEGLTVSMDLGGLEPGENLVPVAVTPVAGITVIERTETVRVYVGAEEPVTEGNGGAYEPDGDSQ